MDNFKGNDFDLPPEVLDQIQENIEEIIKSFPIAESNKIDVIKKINFMYSRTKYMSVTDPLTGLYNRRHFENTIEREFLRAKRYKSDLSIALIDVDFFKKINKSETGIFKSVSFTFGFSYYFSLFSFLLRISIFLITYINTITFF